VYNIFPTEFQQDVTFKLASCVYGYFRIAPLWHYFWFGMRFLGTTFQAIVESQDNLIPLYIHLPR
jgi:hypothetical protein